MREEKAEENKKCLKKYIREDGVNTGCRGVAKGGYGGATPPNIQFVGKLMISEHQATVRMTSIARTVSNFDYIIEFFCRQVEGSAPPQQFSFASPLTGRTIIM